MPFWHCISSFESTSYKKLQDRGTNSFISCFTSAFTSAYIIIIFLQIFWTLFNIIGLIIFVTDFPFNRFTWTPNPFNNQYLLSVTKFFVDAVLPVDLKLAFIFFFLCLSPLRFFTCVCWGWFTPPKFCWYCRQQLRHSVFFSFSLLWNLENNVLLLFFSSVLSSDLQSLTKHSR